VENKVSDFLNRNWSIIVGVLSVAFVSGGVVSEFRLMRAQMEENEREHQYQIEQLIKERDRKSDWLQEQEERIDELEEWRAFEEGKHSK